MIPSKSHRTHHIGNNFWQTLYTGTLLMQPGRGFLLKVATAQTFRYDPAPPAGAPAGPMALAASGGPGWQSPVGKENSMTLYVRVELSGQRMETGGSLLGIFEGAQLAGVASLVNGPSGKLFPLTVWSNSVFSPGLSVKAWDAATSRIVDLTPSVNFTLNGISGTIANPLIFSGSALTPIEAWRWAEFGSPDNTGDGADAANPSRDGIENLVKYALNLNPHKSSTDKLPSASLVTEATGRHLSITFTRTPARSDVNLFVEVSGNLQTGSWTTIAGSVNGAPFTGLGLVSEVNSPGGTTTIEARDPVPVSDASRRYLRIRVVR